MNNKNRNQIQKDAPPPNQGGSYLVTHPPPVYSLYQSKGPQANFVNPHSSNNIPMTNSHPPYNNNNNGPQPIPPPPPPRTLPASTMEGAGAPSYGHGFPPASSSSVTTAALSTTTNSKHSLAPCADGMSKGARKKFRKRQQFEQDRKSLQERYLKAREKGEDVVTVLVDYNKKQQQPHASSSSSLPSSENNKPRDTLQTSKESQFNSNPSCEAKISSKENATKTTQKNMKRSSNDDNSLNTMKEEPIGKSRRIKGNKKNEKTNTTVNSDKKKEDKAATSQNTDKKDSNSDLKEIKGNEGKKIETKGATSVSDIAVQNTSSNMDACVIETNNTGDQKKPDNDIKFDNDEKNPSVTPRPTSPSTSETDAMICKVVKTLPMKKRAMENGIADMDTTTVVAKKTCPLNLSDDERLAKMESACQTILECVGEDPDREGLVKTPSRWAKALLFLTRGYHPQNGVSAILNEAVFEEDHREMVLVRDIDVHSLCEHHMLPFSGVVHVGYVPNGKVLGLSKIARIAEVFCRRLQVQERLTSQIADALIEAVEPLGVAVVMECSHFCMVMRGVQKTGSTTVTSAVRGCFQKCTKTRAEFFSILNRPSSKRF